MSQGRWKRLGGVDSQGSFLIPDLGQTEQTQPPSAGEAPGTWGQGWGKAPQWKGAASVAQAEQGRGGEGGRSGAWGEEGPQQGGVIGRGSSFGFPLERREPQGLWAGSGLAQLLLNSGCGVEDEPWGGLEAGQSREGPGGWEGTGGREGRGPGRRSARSDGGLGLRRRHEGGCVELGGRAGTAGVCAKRRHRPGGAGGGGVGTWGSGAPSRERP